jgi:hypothetical protein
MQITAKSGCLIALMCLSAPAAAVGEDRPILDLSQLEVKVGVSLVTEHVGAERNFNETNPSAFLNIWRSEVFFSADMGVEAGLFENSFSDLSATINGWAEWPVLGGPEAVLGQLNIGAALGVARYPNLVDEAQDLNLPTLGNFVPFVAGQVTWLAPESLEFRARATPIGGDADFVVGLQAFLRL